MTYTPTVFISYSHDSDAHCTFVLSLANRLREDGVDCRIDQYIKGFPSEGWQRWMENNIEEADFVLIMCTPLYLRRYRGQDSMGGRGVNFEGVVISQTLYDYYYHNIKFIPVIPENGSLEDIPLPLKGYTPFPLPQNYTNLYRLLTDQHATPAPEIGERLKLESGGFFQPLSSNKRKLKEAFQQNKASISDRVKTAYNGTEGNPPIFNRNLQ